MKTNHEKSRIHKAIKGHALLISPIETKMKRNKTSRPDRILIGMMNSGLMKQFDLPQTNN